MTYIAIISTNQDNYCYLLNLDGTFIVIDPGQAAPVLTCMHLQGCGLDLILNTHMHQDHCHANMELKQATGCIIMGSDARIPGLDQLLTSAGNLPSPGQALQMIPTPGHTLNDCCYYLPAHKGHPGALFTGDTLFSGGCGRVFEGSIEQLFKSLSRLKTLPADTLIYSGHEYTLDNYRFAEHIEPDSEVVRRKLRQVEHLRHEGRPTLPVSLEGELETNPFLRPHDPVLRHALNMEDASDLEVFTELRQRKNRF